MESLPGWSDPTGKTPAQLKDLEVVFGRIVGLATYIALLVVFIMLVNGGFKYITSGGDPKKAEVAKNTITYALLGLVALIGIWFILKLISIFTGVDVTQFIISTS